MASRQVEIKCDLLARMGRTPEQGVPFQALSAWVTALFGQVPDADEATCMVFGTELMVARYDHTLSPLESALLERDNTLALLRAVKGQFLQDGQLRSGAAAEIAELLKAVP